MTPVYVYALVEERIRRVRADGRTLEAVSAGDIFAIVERTSARPPLSERSLRVQHAIVARLAQRVDAILPARFGSLVDLPELDALARTQSGVLHEALELVRGREQMTVRLFRRAPVARTVGPDATRGRDYLLARARAAGSDPLADQLREPVKGLVAGERLEPEAAEGRFTVHHLIVRGAEARYRTLVGRAIARLPSCSAARVSGPWPPYAFAPNLWR